MEGALPTRPAEAAARTDAERALLASVCERLNGFLAGSEDVFLEAGRRLQTMQASAQQLVGASAASADGLEQKNPVGAVRELLAQIGAHLDKSREGTTADAVGLGRLIGKVGLIPRYSRDYHGLASALRLIAIQTSIENAKSDARQDTVAHDTKRLAAEIEPRFDDVLQRAERLETVARAARERVLGFMAQQGKRSQALVADTDEGLGALEVIAASSAELSATAALTKDRVAARVSEVLFALQTHDSARQVVEHVIEELRDLEKDPGVSREQWLAEVAELSRLTARQLEGGRARLCEGLGQIAGSLFDLAGGVTEFAGKAAALASGNGGELLQKVEHGIGESARLLRQQDTEEKTLAQAVHQVGETLQDMVACITSIDKVGHEVKMLSLNAMVEAGHVTTGSRVFAALAHEMTDQAGQVHDLNQVVGGALEKVASEAMQLDRTWEVGGAEEGSVADDFDRVVATLRSWHAELTTEAQALGQGSKGVVSVAEEVARSLELQAQATQQLSVLEQELVGLADAAAALAGPAATGVRSKRLIEATARYTMESERAVHAAAAGHRPATAPQLAAALPAAATVASGGADGLGDNVELF